LGLLAAITTPWHGNAALGHALAGPGLADHRCCCHAAALYAVALSHC
jgi:hypothetical protein